MIDADFPLNQKITIVFDTDEPPRHIVLTIIDSQDDNAAGNTEAWAAGDFELDDLLCTLARNAEITLEENGNTESYTGATFEDGGMLVDLDGVEPTSVTFVDLEPAAGEAS